jgi:rhodanese-related sulfurtransferase
MKLSISQWGLHGKLALVALALGAVAVLGDPYGGGTVKIHPRELALEVHNEVDHVTARQLAGWIIEGKSDYRLIDLRDAPVYATYHIPGAENVPLTDLPGDLARNDKIVLYSGGGIHSAQAWFLLKAQGYNASYILLGGLDEWNDSVLNPTLPANPTPAQTAAFEKDRHVSAFFGGTPRIASAGTATAALAPVPSVTAPPRAAAPVAPSGPAPVKKKKKEG